jgi:aspartate carbamoyltransferase regulatory subunit
VDDKEIIAKLLEYLDHLENSNGVCDCFECCVDRRERNRVIKRARKTAEEAPAEHVCEYCGRVNANGDRP